MRACARRHRASHWASSTRLRWQGHRGGGSACILHREAAVAWLQDGMGFRSRVPAGAMASTGAGANCGAMVATAVDVSGRESDRPDGRFSAHIGGLTAGRHAAAADMWSQGLATWRVKGVGRGGLEVGRVVCGHRPGSSRLLERAERAPDAVPRWTVHCSSSAREFGVRVLAVRCRWSSPGQGSLP
jgi:hypothetical protein